MSGYAAVLPGCHRRPHAPRHRHLSPTTTGPSARLGAGGRDHGLRDLGVGDDTRTQFPTEELPGLPGQGRRGSRLRPVPDLRPFCGRRWHGYGHAMSDGRGDRHTAARRRRTAQTQSIELLDIGCDGIKTAVDRGRSHVRRREASAHHRTAHRHARRPPRQRGVWCCAHVLES